jgi:hypothetical protein
VATGSNDRPVSDPLRWIPWVTFVLGLLPFLGLAIRGSADNVELGIAAVLLCSSIGAGWLFVKRHHWFTHA